MRRKAHHNLSPLAAAPASGDCMSMPETANQRSRSISGDGNCDIGRDALSRPMCVSSASVVPRRVGQVGRGPRAKPRGLHHRARMRWRIAAISSSVSGVGSPESRPSWISARTRTTCASWSRRTSPAGAAHVGELAHADPGIDKCSQRVRQFDLHGAVVHCWMNRKRLRTVSWARSVGRQRGFVCRHPVTCCAGTARPLRTARS